LGFGDQACVGASYRRAVGASANVSESVGPRNPHGDEMLDYKLH